MNARVREQALERAQTTLRAIRNPRLYSRRRRLYGTRRSLLLRDYEALWPFADAWSALSTLWSLDHSTSGELASFLEAIPAYARTGDVLDEQGPLGFESRVTPPLGGGGDRFYDDNAWVGLALTRHRDLTGDDRALSLARRLLEFDLTGWATDRSWSHPGGIRWKEPASCVSRNTCSNAPVAELALLVHRATRDSSALEWAIRIYNWVRSCLLGPDGLYLDRIDPSGSVADEVYTYNQGTMIGAGVLLHDATGDDEYLVHAQFTERAGRSRFSTSALMGQDAAFNAVWFRNLLLLDETSYDPARLEAAVEYAEGMWQKSRDPRTGLFGGGDSPLNATAPMIEIYALIAGAQPHP
jgi:Glycosyl hydrolase family 76